MREQRQEGRDLRYYLRLVWLRKWLLLAVILAIPTAVYFVSKALPKTYEASSTLRVSQTSISGALFGTATFTDSADVTATLIKTSAVAQRAARQLGEPPSSAGSLLGSINVETVSLTGSESSEFLTLTGSADNPQRAADVANAFARAISNARTDQAIGQIDETIATLAREAENATPEERAAPGGVNEQIQQLRALKASQEGTTAVIEPAAPPGSPVSPHPERNAGVGLVLAILIAAGLVPLFERLDRRIRDADDLERLLGVPVLVHIPETAFPGGGSGGQEVREAFQTLRASLTTFNVDRKLETVIVSSPMHGEGKTTVATNLAIALAQDERDVILVDGDLRRPQVMSRFGSSIEWGLDAVLLGERSLDDALLELEVEGTGRLRLLPGGITAPNPAVLLGSRRMRSLLGELSARTDLVVLDTPPILAVSDAIPLLDDVSGTVLVARVDYSSSDAVKRAAQVIEAAGGALLGAVATGTPAAGLYGYEDHAYSLPRGRGFSLRRRRRRRRAVREPSVEGLAVPEEEPAAPPLSAEVVTKDPQVAVEEREVPDEEAWADAVGGDDPEAENNQRRRQEIEAQRALSEDNGGTADGELPEPRYHDAE